MPAIVPTRVLLLLLLAAPLLALAGWLARDKAMSIEGPTALAARGNVVLVAREGLLHRLDSKGELVGTLDAAAEGVWPQTLGFLDGETLLLGSTGEGYLARCTLAPFACNDFTESTVQKPEGELHTLVADGMVWIAESNWDRIHRYAADGTRIDTPLSIDLAQPRGLARSANLLLVADAGNRRVQSYVVHRRGFDEPQTFAEGFAAPDEEDPVDRPLALQPANDGWWLLLNNAARSRGGVLRLDADGTLQYRVDLPEDALPVAMARSGSDLLVADAERMQLWRVDANGTAAPWESAALEEVLAPVRDERALLRVASTLLMALAALLAAVAGSLWLWRSLPHPGSEPLPLVRGDQNVQWLPGATDLLPRRLARNLAALLPSALAPALALAVLLPALPWPAWPGLVLALGAVITLVDAQRDALPRGTRLGLRERNLVYTDAEKGLREFLLLRVVWDEDTLQPADDLSIPLTRAGRDLFHRPTLATHLFPRLNPARRSDAPGGPDAHDTTARALRKPA